jgi:hypothetical protein
MATRRIQLVYNLAADMGGIGYIGTRRADIARNNISSTPTCWGEPTERHPEVPVPSSACVYAQYKQAERRSHR